MSEAAKAAWDELGGADGRLGCPTAAETATIPSRLGTPTRIVAFDDRGAIVLPQSGPGAGTAAAIFGCAFTLWTQYGGPGGTLGDPLAAATNTPDGWTQPFEGGRIITTRALDTCDVEQP
ncbi:MAG TPA: hypothetical protein VG248_03275 [Caulobacteraceae bacterium]|jgi:uncharacterized protein with LGFP repeats|nr:hypothetical protein [Caulobacteraceae bacterium]